MKNPRWCEFVVRALVGSRLIIEKKLYLCKMNLKIEILWQS